MTDISKKIDEDENFKEIKIDLGNVEELKRVKNEPKE